MTGCSAGAGRSLASSVAGGLLIGVSRIAPRGVLGRPTGALSLVQDARPGLVHHRKAPAPARQLARHCRRHERRAKAAAALELVPAVVKPEPRLFGAGAHLGALSGAPALDHGAYAQRRSVVPGGLHQEASCVGVAGLGDRAAAVACP